MVWLPRVKTTGLPANLSWLHCRRVDLGFSRSLLFLLSAQVPGEAEWPRWPQFTPCRMVLSTQRALAVRARVPPLSTDEEAWMHPVISHQLCEVTVHLIIRELHQGTWDISPKDKIKQSPSVHPSHIYTERCPHNHTQRGLKGSQEG